MTSCNSNLLLPTQDSSQGLVPRCPVESSPFPNRCILEGSYLEGPGGKLLERGSLGPRREAQRGDAARRHKSLSAPGSRLQGHPPYEAVDQRHPEETEPCFCAFLARGRLGAAFIDTSLTGQD